MKEEALQLAKYLDRLNGYMDMPRDILDITQPSSAMIRRLVERMVELESCLDFAVQDTMDYITLNNLGGENNHWLVWARKLLINKTLQTKPLSDEEIVSIWEKANYESKYYEASDNFAIEFARAIEERHGIK